MWHDLINIASFETQPFFVASFYILNITAYIRSAYLFHLTCMYISNDI